MAIPSSLPVSSTSVQRRTSVWPGAQARPVTMAERAVRLAAALPSSAAFEPVVVGAVKLSAGTLTKVPVFRSVAPRA